jgi:hypothetical protein
MNTPTPATLHHHWNIAYSTEPLPDKPPKYLEDSWEWFAQSETLASASLGKLLPKIDVDQAEEPWSQRVEAYTTSFLEAMSPRLQPRSQEKLIGRLAFG